MIKHIGGSELLGPWGTLTWCIENHRLVEVLPGRRAFFRKIGFHVRVLSLPLGPEAIDIAVMQPKDRIIGRTHIQHVAAHPPMDQIVERNFKLDTKAPPLSAIIRVAQAILPRGCIVRRRG